MLPLFVCPSLTSVRESTASGNQVAIINLKEGNSVVRKNMSADSAIMHPSQFIIALRAQGRTLQVVNLGSRQRVGSATMDEDVVYWRWVSPKTLGLVTGSHIYHWNVLDDSLSPTNSSPRRIVERHASLAGCQIINYTVSSDDQGSGWSALTGIAQQNDRIVGKIQLYSAQRNVSQGIEGHAAAFGRLRLDGASSDTQVFCFANKLPQGQGAKLHIVEIDHEEGNPVYQKKAVDVFFPPEATNDFPVSVQVAQKYGVLYIVTKYGFIHLYDLESGSCIYMNRISSETVFTASGLEDKGVLAINRRGQVLSVSVNDDTIVQYVLQNLGNTGLALGLASRGGLPGADNLYSQQFNQLLTSGNYLEAAKVAAASPRGLLRTRETIQRLKSVQAAPGQISPILQYFSTLLDSGSLNKFESIELAVPVLQQDRKPLFEKWLTENKLESSEELGDIVRQYDVNLALSVYLRANVPLKVVAAFAECGQFDQIVPYCQKVGYTPDYVALLQNLVRVNPDKASEFATQLVNSGDHNLDLDRVVDVFLSQNLIQQATAFLLDALKDNKPEQGHLQTRLLEVNLMNAPQVADAILGNDMFSHFDRARIAQLCEKAGLLQRALELYDDLKDIKRVVVHTNNLNPDWLVGFFGKLTVDQTLESLREMLRVNVRQNLQVVVQVATKYSELVGPSKLIKMFEEFKATDGLYYYLQTIVNLSDDHDVVYKYIECAAKLGQSAEIERVVRDNNAYNPEKVKNLLKDAKLADQLPLMIVCNRFNFVHDLVLYLYQNDFRDFIKIFVQRVNPQRTPEVVGALLDVDCDESTIKDLLQSVLGQVPIEPLVLEVEKRNRLKLLLPYLEAVLAGGSQDSAVYDALAKIYIDSNNNPEKFLKENNQYNPLVVGKYCETRDPYLAFIAYEKGQNDYELIRITNENNMYKHQARYLVSRADDELWEYVLGEDNIHRRQVIDQVVGVAVPESTSPEDVSVAVKSFMKAQLPGELVELLEKIILEPSPFNDNASLQNLLILTTIQADSSRVADYIERLDKYDVDDIAQICIENHLYEEAFKAYNKAERYSDALEVLVGNVVSLDRAEEYAEKVDQAEIWSQLGRAQLNGLRINEALESYQRAKDPSNFAEVVEIASRAGKDAELIPFLEMARANNLREPMVDGQLIVSYANAGKLREVQNVLNSPNVADLDNVGDTLYEQGQYEAAKIIFTNICNWAKLATTQVFLEDFSGAVESARKANNVKVWKQVNEACVEKREFRLAQLCGLNLIVHAEELRGLVEQYEYIGCFDELMSLFEQGLGLERAHMGMFTELAVLYAKYRPAKLMEHLKLFWSRINIPKAIRACEQAHLWPELVFLYCHYDEWDNAALAMMDHAADAFEHNAFKDVIVKVSNLEIYYKAIDFYMAEQPPLLTDLLAALAPRVDVSRVVRMFQKSDNLPLIKPFLVNVQDRNLLAVNSAYHDLLIEELDYKALRVSVDSYDRYDAIDLAQRLEKHDLIFFRQIAAHLFRKNKKWSKSIALSKEDRLWKDVIATAAASERADVAQDVVKYFVDIGNRECFVAALYACYELLRSDYIMELGWRHGLENYTMPYRINLERERSLQLEAIHKDFEERKEKERQAQQAAEDEPVLGQRLMITQGFGGGF